MRGLCGFRVPDSGSGRASFPVVRRPLHTHGIFLAALVHAAPLLSQTTGELAGVVRDETGEPLAGAAHWVDLQLSKSLEVGPARLTLIGTVMNLLDEEEVIRVCDGYYGCVLGDVEIALDDPLAHTQPRRYELGARVEF